MISRLRGEVVTRSASGIVVDVGGVGYLLSPTAGARRKAEPGAEVVLELKEKIAPLAAVDAPHLGGGDGHIVARDALVELGYPVAEAEQRLADTDPDLPPAERVRQALRAA